MTPAEYVAACAMWAQAFDLAARSEIEHHRRWQRRWGLLERGVAALVVGSGGALLLMPWLAGPVGAFIVTAVLAGLVIRPGDLKRRHQACADRLAARLE